MFTQHKLVDSAYFWSTGKILDPKYPPPNDFEEEIRKAKISVVKFESGLVEIILIDGSKAIETGSPYIGAVPSIFNAALSRAYLISDFRKCPDSYAAEALDSYRAYKSRRNGIYEEAHLWASARAWRSYGRPDNWVDADKYRKLVG